MKNWNSLKEIKNLKLKNLYYYTKNTQMNKSIS